MKQQLLAEGLPRAERVHFVEGFYNVSLTRTLADERDMRPALYVDLDVDLYTSTSAALDWLFDRRLLPVGAVLYYDDWGSGGLVGQRRAHRDAFFRHSKDGANATEVPGTRRSLGMRVYQIAAHVAGASPCKRLSGSCW